MVENKRNSPVKNGETNRPGSKSRSFRGSHVLALALGVAIGVFGMGILGNGSSAPLSMFPPSRNVAEQPSDPRPMAQRQPTKTQEDRQPSASRKEQAFDPIAEAERINEINRRNMQRTMQPPVPRTPVPGVPRAGMPQPPRPRGPVMPTPPSVPSVEEP